MKLHGFPDSDSDDCVQRVHPWGGGINRAAHSSGEGSGRGLSDGAT
jgi:hypothetical protein